MIAATPFASLAWSVALPEVFLACAAMALLVLGVCRRGNPQREISMLAAVALVVTSLLVFAQGGVKVQGFAGLFVVDGFALFLKQLVLLAAVLGIVMAVPYLESEGLSRFEYPVLILLATLGMLMMLSANDLMSLYLGLELQSLSLYVVAAFARDSERSTEAGLKYFVLGALASGLLLYGASLVYGFAGSTNFTALAQLLAKGQVAGAPAAVPTGVVVGLVFIAAALAFKVSAVPFHMWTPDVYAGAPTPVTAFFSIGPKLAAIGLFLRVMTGPFGPLVGQWQQLMVLVSIASMVLGALAAIGQSNIKRLMAYSSIGHMGYALIGLAAGTVDGVHGVLVYVAIYLVMNAGSFACILAMRREGRMVEGIGDLAGLARTDPGMALALAVFMFSMAGIPPLAGFFGKLYVFLAAVKAGLWTLAVIGVLASVVGAYYYLRIIKIMYFDEPAGVFEPRPATLSAVIAGTGAVTALLFVWPGPLLGAAQVAAASLFGG